MSIRVRPAEEVRLELSRGDYLIVKQDLNAGEYRDLIRDSSKPVSVGLDGAMGTFDLDPIAAGLTMVLAYLLDWSFQDPNGHPIVIRHQSRLVLRSALDAIDAASYMEVQRAIQQHDAARQFALADEKKTPSGGPAPDRTLTSVG